jgi:O-antigen/teichoic acid export membrane protein
VPVGVGLAMLGAGAYAHLAVAGHRLDPDGFSSLSVLWVLVYTAGIGVFMPIEQEISRYVAMDGGVGGRAGTASAPRRVVAIAGGLLIGLTGLLIAGAEPLAAQLFGGEQALVWTLAAALAGLGLAHVSRGLLAGGGQFRRYGAQLAADGALRIVLVALLALVGARNPVWYGLVLAAAPAVAVVLTAHHRSARLPPGSGTGWARLLRGLGLLIASSLLAQVVVNVAVVNARLLAPGEATAGAVLAALVLVRVPLFVFASLQAPLLSGLAARVAAGDTGGFRQLLRRGVAVAAALGAAGGVPVVLCGPWLVTVGFGAPDMVGRTEFALLAAGSFGYLCALALGQGLLVRDRHGHLTGAWAAGVVALLAVTLLPVATPAPLRVAAGYAAGSLIAAAGMWLLLRRRDPTDRGHRTARARQTARRPTAKGGPR